MGQASETPPSSRYSLMVVLPLVKAFDILSEMVSGVSCKVKQFI